MSSQEFKQCVQEKKANLRGLTEEKIEELCRLQTAPMEAPGMNNRSIEERLNDPTFKANAEARRRAVIEGLKGLR